MQYHPKYYDPELHDKWFALTVKERFANKLIEEAFQIDGVAYAEKSIDIRSKNTPYRGDVMICGVDNNNVISYGQTSTLGLVELYDIKPVSDFTDDEWARTLLSDETRQKIKGGWGWFFRNPRTVLEFPVRSTLGINTLVYTKDVVIEYPQSVIFDSAAYDQIMQEAKNIFK